MDRSEEEGWSEECVARLRKEVVRVLGWQHGDYDDGACDRGSNLTSVDSHTGADRQDAVDPISRDFGPRGRSQLSPNR